MHPLTSRNLIRKELKDTGPMSGSSGNAAALFRWLGVQECQAHTASAHTPALQHVHGLSMSARKCEYKAEESGAQV